MSDRLFFPATNRNRDSIGIVLADVLPISGVVLEVASGSGEHAVAFQKQFPKITWQASDPDLIHRKSISAWIKYEGLNEKMPNPLNLNVEMNPWPFPENSSPIFSAVICINMIHVSTWRCCESLFQGSKNHLCRKSPIIIYGPFMRGGRHTSNSNSIFNKSLKDINPEWGIRNLEDVIKAAKKEGFQETNIIRMPANNLCIIFLKD